MKSALAYTNRRGDVFYLHAGKTKTGKPRYFVAKKVGDGALAAMPEGWEFTESVNCVVSVRRIDPEVPTIPAEDLAVVRAELGRRAHLRFHRADAVQGSIIVFEPQGGVSLEGIAVTAKSLGMDPRLVEQRLAGLQTRNRYTPVLKFTPCGRDGYALHRMTYRGDGGWSWELKRGPLAKVAAKILRLVGTERFFDLM